MKKFFKALALVLALTLVIGTIPASAASTAKFTMKKNKKILYIDGSKGEKADGSATCKTLSKFTVTKWIEGFDAETMDLKLKTADKTIASKSNKYDRVYAKGIGTVKVTLYIYDKDTKRQIGTISNFKVKVKKNDTIDGKVANAVEGSYSNLEELVTTGQVNPEYYTKYDAENPAPTTLGVNVGYLIRLTRKDADGKYTDTDARNLVCLKDGKAVEDVQIVKLSNTLFGVVFKAAGKFTLTAQAYQSGSFDKVLDTEDFEIKVGYDVEDAKQEALDSVRVSFATPVKEGSLDAASFELYSLQNEKKIAFTKVAGIEYLKDEPTVAIVKFYRNFAEGQTYFLKYEDQEPIEFKTSVVTGDSVASIEVADIVAEAGVWTEFKFKARNAEGVDITSSSKIKETGFTVEISPANEGASYKKTSDKKHLVKVDKADGKEFTVTVNYKWNSTVDGANKVCPNPGVAKLTAVDAAAWEVADFNAVLTTADAKAAYKADGSRDGDVKALEIDGVPAFSLSEASSKVKVQFQVKYSRTNVATGETKDLFQSAVAGQEFKKTNTKTYADYKADDQILYSKYVLESSDKNIIMIGSGNNLIANKEGTATILVKGIDKNDKNVAVVVGTFDVTVREKRKAATFDVTVKDNKEGLNKTYAADSIVYNFEVKDQFGAVMQGKTVNATNYNPNNETGIAVLNKTLSSTSVATGASITVRPGDINVPTSTDTQFVVNIKFECTDNDLGDAKSKIIALNVSTDSNVDSYKLSLSGDKLSTNFNAKSEKKTIVIGLEARNVDNFLVAPKTSATFTGVTPSGDVEKPSDFTKGNYYYTVVRDGAQVKNGGFNFNTTTNTFTNIAVSPQAINVTGAAVKLQAGTYTVTLYQVDDIDGKYIDSHVVDTKSFTVVDDQTALTAAKKNDISGNITKANVLSAFEIKFGDAKVTTDAVINGDGTKDTDDWHIAEDKRSAYVYTVRYLVEVNNKDFTANYWVSTSVNAIVESK